MNKSTGVRFLPKRYWWVWRGVHFTVAQTLTWAMPGERTTLFGRLRSDSHNLNHFVVGPLLISWEKEQA